MAFRVAYGSIVKANDVEYNVTLDLNLPVVNVGTPEAPSYFPAEVCIMQTGKSVSAASSSVQNRRPVHVRPEITVAGAKERLNSPLNPTLVRTSDTLPANEWSLSVKFFRPPLG